MPSQVSELEKLKNIGAVSASWRAIPEGYKEELRQMARR